MIQTILWDVDGTLLDFLAAEEAAIRKLFVEFDMGECSDEMLTRYSKDKPFLLGAAGSETRSQNNRFW